MTPLQSFYARIERLPWSRSILGQNDTPGVVLSQDRRTPLESFYPRIEGLPWSRSILGLNDSPGVVQSQDSMTTLDRMTLLESFCPGMKRLKDYPRVVLSQDRRTPLESFHQDRLPWSRSIP